LFFIPLGYGNATQVTPRFAGIAIPYVNGTYGVYFIQNEGVQGKNGLLFCKLA